MHVRGALEKLGAFSSVVYLAAVAAAASTVVAAAIPTREQAIKHPHAYPRPQ